MSFVNKVLVAIGSGLKHVFLVKRFTLRYPQQRSVLYGDGYKYDPKEGVGIAGYRGRHILFTDKCTGCSLCFIMCQGISTAIEMIHLENIQVPVNKKSNFPQIDYSKCVYCGFCVDACPFYALVESNEYEIDAYDRESLIFTPEQLAILPKPPKGTLDITYEGGAHHA